MWYTWKWSCSEDAVGVDVLVEFPTHCWLSDCWLRLKREDVHVQKQWGSLNTASGSSCKPQAQMFSMVFYDSSYLFFSPDLYPTRRWRVSSVQQGSLDHTSFSFFFFFIFFFHFVSNRSWKWSISKDRHCSEKFRKVMKCTRTHTHTLWELITIQSPPNDVQYFYQLFLFLEQRPQCRIQTIYFSLAAR